MNVQEMPEHPLRAFRRKMDWGAKVVYNRAVISNTTLFDIEGWKRLPSLETAYKILPVIQEADPDGEWTVEKLFPPIPN